MDLLARGLALTRELVAGADSAIAALDSAPDAALAQAAEILGELDRRAGDPLPPAGAMGRLRAAGLLFVGDFATDPHGRELTAALCRALAPRLLLLPFPTASQAHLLEALRQGRISSAGFRDESAFDQFYPPYAWPSFLALCRQAWALGVALAPLDEGLDGSLPQRNREAARRLVALADRTAGRGPVVVLAGELRLAGPTGLAELAVRQRSAGSGGLVRLLLDCSGCWLAALADGRSGRGWFGLDGETIVHVAQSPLARRLSFLSWHHHGELPVPGGHLAAAFERYRRRIASRFSLPSGPGPLVVSPGDPRYLALAARRGGLDAAAIDFLAQEAAAGESRCLPEAGMVYLGSLVRSHVAEEAAHWLRAATGGADLPEDSGEERFWAVAVNELLGYVGSKVVAPERLPLPALSEQASARLTPEQLAHYYGYGLGERLWRRLDRQPELCEWLRAAFLKDLVEPGAAKGLYFAGLERAAAGGRRRR